MKTRSPSIDRAFGELHPENPLLKLNSGDRERLWALLVVSPTGRDSSGAKDAMSITEEIGKLAADMQEVAEKLTRLFEDAFLKSWEPLRPFHVVPAMMDTLAGLLGETATEFGADGHRHKYIRKYLLARASRLVKSRTGYWHDEHLAELIQNIKRASDEREISGDALRKIREHLQKTSPKVWASLIKS